MPQQNNNYDKKHLRNIAVICARIDRIFNKAAEEAALVGATIKDDLGDRIFSFNDYPQTRKQIDALTEELHASLEMTIVNGIDSAWALSNSKNDALVRRVFGRKADDLPEAQRRRYFNNNAQALEAFLARKTQGLGLSDRVWRYTDEFKNEIELGLDLGIRSGKSAAAMTRDLRQYLQHPDKLFRRVRDEHGLLKLSQAAKDFHPGRGVYRSSYMNARRLAATETNIAYRTADHLRWQKMDFVVGIEIVLSNNHTIRLQPGEKTSDLPGQMRADGTPKANAVRTLTDICDTLAGRYPKDFKFTGWHPHCRCRAVTILKTEEEMARDSQRILDGKQPSADSTNAVTDTPEAFKNWVENNRDRIKHASSVPYFIRDNKSAIKELTGVISAPKHGTQRLGRKDKKLAHDAFSDHTPKHDYTKKQTSNMQAFSKSTGIQRGATMTFNEADNGLANIFNDRNNCASCVIAHELRLRGFDLSAVAYDPTKGSSAQLLSENTLRAWKRESGKPVQFDARLGGSLEKIRGKLEKMTRAIGSRYHISWDGRFQDYGHIITAERTEKGLIFYDPQRNRTWSLEEIEADMKQGSCLEILRVDRLLLDIDNLAGLFMGGLQQPQ